MSPILLIGAVAIVAAVGVLVWAVAAPAAEAVDLSGARSAVAGGPVAPTASPLDRIGARFEHVLPTGRVRILQRKLQQLGDENWSVERVIALKLVLTVSLGVVGVLFLLSRPSAMIVLMVTMMVAIGWFGPNAVIEGRIDDRQQQIRKEMSDTIDQLNVMVRAGLSVDSAILRIVDHGSGPFANELARVLQDMRFGIGRHTALVNMAQRVDVPELHAFVAALAQADELGLPLSDTLRVQSEQLRDKRRKAAEEQAMKLPVKMLFPMMVCILPVLFIVILGPAAIEIFETLGSS